MFRSGCFRVSVSFLLCYGVKFHTYNDNVMVVWFTKQHSHNLNTLNHFKQKYSIVLLRHQVCWQFEFPLSFCILVIFFGVLHTHRYKVYSYFYFGDILLITLYQLIQTFPVVHQLERDFGIYVGISLRRNTIQGCCRCLTF